jgi:hypothetical protein
MTQYKNPEEDKWGRPWRKVKLTDSNCAIDIEKQAKLYHEWMNEKRRCGLHLYPKGPVNSTRQRTREYFLDVLPLGRFVIRDVNPEDWK